MLEVLRGIDRDSLVIMDELGSGTDPAEGMGIRTILRSVLTAGSVAPRSMLSFPLEKMKSSLSSMEIFSLSATGGSVFR